ncbi:nuclear transport factor 2 family protein [Phenylobacterium sp.]|uniref:nuclear transport factor 2 family protein n=1 Tax=Phenylobacterium sp. TaxID=1871053 RepID=UPI00286D1788|nr:nuclear transport factor 2 family protein [Phenylobacterium sp.]
MTSQEPELAVARDLYRAFNDPTVEGVMAHFAEGAVYEDPMGGRHEGRAAVRAALAPAFNGGQRYTLGQLFVADGVVVAAWTLEIGPIGERVRLEGMDVLRFADGKIELKQCYMKASGLLMQPVSA